MYTKLLDTFALVYEHRNFNRAAEVLGITQSTVSGRIAKLEKMLNAVLFERGRIGANPTNAGVRFASHVNLLRATWQHAEVDIGIGQDNTKRLRIAGQLSLQNSVLVDWTATLLREVQDIRVDVQANYSTQIINDLLNGRVDIGVLYAPDFHPDLIVSQESDEVFLMVSTVISSVSDLDARTYVKTDYTSNFERARRELFPDLSSARCSVSHEGLSVELLKTIGGTTYIPMRHIPKLQKDHQNLKIVKDAPEIRQPIYSVVHIRRRHDPNVIKSLEILRRLI